MDVFLQNILLMPTGIFTVFLCLITIYWCFVLIGAVDLELLDGADGASEGLLDLDVGMDLEIGTEAGVEAGFEAGFEATSDAITESAGEMMAESIGEAFSESAGDIASGLFVEGSSEAILNGAYDNLLMEGVDASITAMPQTGAGLLSSLKLRSVPLTISLSLIIVFSWMTSYFSTEMLSSFLPFPALINGGVLFVLSLCIGILCTSVLVRPFDGAFKTHPGQRDSDLIGKIAEVETSRIDHDFGEIRVKGRSGTPLIMQARCDHENELQKGDEVLVIFRDTERKAFVIEPIKSQVAIAVEKRLEILRKKALAKQISLRNQR